MQKVIVITGVTGGLGAALVDEFVALGQTVMGCGRTKTVVQSMSQEYGDSHGFSSVDVSDCEQVKQWASDVLDSVGPPDLLINNAAVINRNAPLWSVPAREFAQLMDINVNGVFNVIQSFLPAMLERQAGVIVNLSSGWGRSTSPEVAPYCASKWAIEGLTRALAQELPPGMAAIPLNPGIIHTDMLESCMGSTADHYPMPTIWAETAAPFLLSMDATHNGEPLTVPHN